MNTQESIKVFKIFLNLELKNNFGSLRRICITFLHELASLAFLFYTAKAFLPKSGLFQGNDLKSLNYFSFILISEILFRPFFVTFMKSFSFLKDTFNENRMFIFHLANIKWRKAYFAEVVPSFFVELLRAFLVYLMAASFFSLNNFQGFLAIFLWGLCLIPFIGGIMILGNSIFGLTLRGENYFFKIFHLVIILSGAYFPLATLPHFVQKIFRLLPINPMLESVRLSFTDQSMITWIGSFIYWGPLMIGIGLIFNLIGFYYISKTTRLGLLKKISGEEL